MSDRQHGIITSPSGAKFLVDLVACTCTCGRYQVNNIPCGYAIACIIKLQKEPRNYIPKVFSLQKYLQTYSRNVLPVDTIELEASLHCRRPILNRPRGPAEGAKGRAFRQQVAGGLGGISGRIQHCSGCGKTGRNIVPCREPPELPVTV